MIPQPTAAQQQLDVVVVAADAALCVGDEFDVDVRVRVSPCAQQQQQQQQQQHHAVDEVSVVAGGAHVRVGVPGEPRAPVSVVALQYVQRDALRVRVRLHSRPTSQSATFVLAVLLFLSAATPHCVAGVSTPIALAACPASSTAAAAREVRPARGMKRSGTVGERHGEGGDGNDDFDPRDDNRDAVMRPVALGVVARAARLQSGDGSAHKRVCAAVRSDEDASAEACGAERASAVEVRVGASAVGCRPTVGEPTFAEAIEHAEPVAPALAPSPAAPADGALPDFRPVRVVRFIRRLTPDGQLRRARVASRACPSSLSAIAEAAVAARERSLAQMS